MKMVKIISAILAIVMLFSFVTVAHATDTNLGSITITNATVGQTYNIYKLFDLDSFSDDNYCYVIEETDPWYDFFKTGEGAAYVTIGEGQADNLMVTWDLTDDDAADLADLAIAYAENNSITATKTAMAAATELEFADLELGYYLVDSTVGTLCALTTTNYDTSIADKNQFSTVEKEVKEDSTGVWGTTNDAAVDEKVEFKATITIAEGTAKLVMHDTLTDGFIFNNDVAVEGAVLGTDYTVKTTETCGCTFEIEFDDEYIKPLTAGTELVVTYSATVDADAVIAGTGNANTVKLSYGQDEANKIESAESVTTTYVWEFETLKYTGAEVALAGAKFGLYTDEACTTPVKFTGTNNVYQNDNEGTVVDFTTDATGTFKLTGLDSGVYYLKELEAPAGYNMLKNAIKVEILNDGTVKQDDVEVETVEIENKSGSLLPTTGGVGTILFYTIGGILIIAAVVLLVTKKRMGNTQ